ncbi:adhesion G-protein coupled receptor F1-like [Protopterus annectens]|uniref:adhesion G-protein coupled receptor F1-like n=1 Tax=Protopterus annectens TaxID=7888 RepID=UPI001CFB8C2F|nr:adhesion G-protein coupled receptor F1-like [Protopterus annectens]
MKHHLIMCSYTCEYVYGDGLVKSIPDLKDITVYPLPENIFTYDTILMKGNNSGNTINLTCCVDKENNGYSVFLNTSAHPYLIEGHQDPANKLCYIFNYHVENELGETATCIVKNQLNRSLTSVLKISYIDENRVKCNSPPYGVGEEGTISTITCAPDEAGNIIAICRNNTWTKIKEKCKNKNLIMLLDNVKNINNNNTPEPIDIALPKAVEELVNFSVDGTTNIISPGNLETTIEILEQFANSQISSVNSSTMKNFLTIADLLLEDTNHTNQANWTEANSYDGSSRLLQSLENFAKKYKPQKYGSYNISTNNIELQGVMLNTSNEIPTFEKTFFQNNTVRISKIRSNSVNGDILIVSIGIKKLASLLPLNISNDAKNTNNFSVNGILISTTVNEGITIESISNSFQKNNATLNDVNCVFWNFTNLVWKSDDCLPEQGSTGDIINCTCKHLTSFSILMSYKPIGDIMVLNWITYIGLGVSIGSLLLCIFIEKLVWKVVTKNKTSYIRHVSIVNIAISLLIADIWFIIGIAIQDGKNIVDRNDAACNTATFFIHFFYLALFFWMFVLGLFLFYRLILVFHDISRTAMVIIAFSLGYGSPFIIAIITIAVTLPHRYKQTDACWLNWHDSKALLAFVIPALVIIAANFIFLLVVVIKIMRPAVGERPRQDEKNTMVQIIRSVAILTPLLGITWAFGVATIVGGDQLAFHVIFTILNAFQGLFILIFATLLDSKVRQALKQKRLLSMLTTKSTKTTTSQPSSGPLSRAVDNVFNRKGQSHGVSDGIHSSSNVSSRAYSVLS